MKCEAVQEMLSRYLTDELPSAQKATVADHLSDCAACRDALAFHRSLETRMDSIGQSPMGMQSRVWSQVDRPVKRSAWLTRVLGDPTMKKILISSTAVTALIAATVLMAPQVAGASSTPVETFNKMRAALAAAARSGELTLNLSSDNKGTITVTGTLDGAPLPKDFPLFVKSTVDGDVVDCEVTADLAPENYMKIQFGKDHNTLELISKANPKSKTEIVLDPKSLKPKRWTTLATKDDGLWEMVSSSEYKPKPAAAPGAKADTTIHVHVKMYVGQDASVKVGG